MVERDMSSKIMRERIEWAIEDLKELSKKDGLEFSESIFIKAVECGIAMYIQKERSFSSKKF